MAKNFKYGGSGPKGDPARFQIDTASAALTSGAISVQEGLFGIVDHDVALGAIGILLTDGVFNVPVPATTVKGDRLYLPGTAFIPTEVATGVLTKTAGTNALFGQAITARDSAGNADVKLASQPVPSAV